jgi:hypothetical protein
MLWTRKFADSNLYIFNSCPFWLMLSFAFYSFLSDDDDPKRDAAAAPLLDTLIITKAPSQADAMVVKSPKAPPKKSTLMRAG